MKILIKDKQAERNAWQKQVEKCLTTLAKPYPFNVPNFQVFQDISCYSEVDTEHLYLDEEGNIHYDPTNR